MKDVLKHSFEVLLKNGEYAEAEKLLVPYMKENPDDWDAKLLYGTCRMMQGDAETAKLVHQQAQGHFECGRDIPEEQKSFWDKYKKLIFYGAIGTALILGGYAALKDTAPLWNTLLYAIEGESVAAKYAGPQKTVLELERKGRRENPDIYMVKYAGPQYDEKEKSMWD